MNITLNDILNTPQAWSEFRRKFTYVFDFDLAPTIKKEIYNIAQEEIYKYKVSDVALRRRNPENYRLGDINNIVVEIQFVDNSKVKVICNDITKPQKPVVKGYFWKEDILLIDLVSGTIKSTESSDNGYNSATGVIPNIFNDYPYYGWARPSHRYYRQKMDNYINSPDFKKQFFDSTLYSAKIQNLLVDYLQKYVVHLCNETIKQLQQNK